MRAWTRVSIAATTAALLGMGTTAWAAPAGLPSDPGAQAAHEAALLKAAAHDPLFVFLDEGSPAGMPTTVKIGKKLSITFYGYINAQAVYNDSRMSSVQTPVTTASETNSAGANPHGRGQYSIHGRLTRFGFNLDGAAIDEFFGLKPAGNFEIDFYGGGSQSRNLIRMRKAWLRLTKPLGDDGKGGHVFVQLGQDADVISPLYPSINHDMLMWNTGNLGDRRPQVRLEYLMKSDALSLRLQGAAGLTSAVGADDLDGNGVPDGEAAEMPGFQGRAAVSFGMGAKRPLEFGLWGYRGWHRADSRLAANNFERNWNAYAVGVDVYVPLMPMSEGGKERVWIQGEAWQGGNLADLRGNIGMRIDGTGKPIKGTGGWGELGFRLTESVAIVAGASIDDPNNEDIVTMAAGTPADNKAIWGGLLLNFSPVEIAFDVSYWETGYLRINSGNNTRWHIDFRLHF